MNSAPLGRDIEADDLLALGAWLPPGAAELLRCIGPSAGLALLNAWPGVAVAMPKWPDRTPAGARRWAQLVDIVGECAVEQLAAQYGGAILDIPTCAALRFERRRRWLCAHYDAITAGGAISKAQAVQELGLLLAAQGQPMSCRAIETALDNPARAPGAARAGDPRQLDIFHAAGEVA